MQFTKASSIYTSQINVHEPAQCLVAQYTWLNSTSVR